jgi:hypothetical protein
VVALVLALLVLARLVLARLVLAAPRGTPFTRGDGL